MVGKVLVYRNQSENGSETRLDRVLRGFGDGETFVEVVGGGSKVLVGGKRKKVYRRRMGGSKVAVAKNAQARESQGLA